MLFSCPICGGKFQINSRGGMVCNKNHSFDRAREGYYNLLVGRGGSHGDNIEMVNARRSFLAAGHYLPMARVLGAMILQYGKEHILSGYPILDSGSGEGYYTSFVYNRLKECYSNVKLFGFDISKSAVKTAAKHFPEITFCVASSYNMPIPSESVGLVMNIFSPLAKDETKRILTRGGHFIMVIPGARHLFDLKSAIYDTPYENTVENKHIDGFLLADERTVNYRIKLFGSEIRDLFMMTPYAYRTSAGGRERVAALTELDTEIDFLVLVYKKL